MLVDVLHLRFENHFEDFAIFKQLPPTVIRRERFELAVVHTIKTYRQTDGASDHSTEGQTDNKKQTDRQIDGQTESDIGRQADKKRQTEIQTDKRKTQLTYIVGTK
jgi:hypothetical protein